VAIFRDNEPNKFMEGRASHKMKGMRDKSTPFRGSRLLEQLNCLKKYSLGLSLISQCKGNVQPQGVSGDFTEGSEIICSSVHFCVGPSPYIWL